MNSAVQKKSVVYLKIHTKIKKNLAEKLLYMNVVSVSTSLTNAWKTYTGVVLELKNINR